MLLPFAALAGMFSHPFMRYAFLAGTAVAVASGLVGYFAVLRSQMFVGDALSHAAFTGAFAALVVGLDARLGLFIITVAVALGMGLLGSRGHADDVVIGSVFAWVLGLGVLLLAIYTTERSTTNGAAGPAILFGSIFGLTAASAGIAALLALVTAGVLLIIARPLLFASVDEAVAAAQGVPVRALSLGFLALIALTTAESTQVVGALLLLGLLAAPAAAAQRLTTRPFRGLALAAVLAVAAVWVGLTVSYAAPRLPPSFAVIACAALPYAAIALVPGVVRRLRRRSASRIATEAAV
ncbi:MAG TPA: metal ABC transporter permease [Dehalococcoidia bacterium]|nr:metal ABC transporter permease [Dehalococcoidia bacterium]